MTIRPTDLLAISYEARRDITTMKSGLFDILLVEDDLGDIDLAKEAFDTSQFSVNLHIVRDGMSAVNYLRRQGEYSNANLPDIILLDLNLPCKNGQDVLKEIKGDDALKHIPVIVLTTSDSQDEILKSYALGANCYINKPLGLDEFIQVIQAIEYYWFTIVKLPNRAP